METAPYRVRNLVTGETFTRATNIEAFNLAMDIGQDMLAKHGIGNLPTMVVEIVTPD